MDGSGGNRPFIYDVNDLPIYVGNVDKPTM